MPSRDTVSAWLRDHVILASIIVLLCSATPRLGLTAAAVPEDLIRPDSHSYLHPARHLLAEGLFLDERKRPEVTRTPGYPVFLASLMSVVGQDLHKVLLGQAAAVSFSVLFLYWLARRILPPDMAFAGALVTAFSPWGAALAGVPLTEGLFVLLLALTFLSMKLTQEAKHLRHALFGSALVGVLTGAVILVRPFWPLLLLIGAALFVQFGPRRAGAAWVLIVTIGCAAAPLALWQARNAHEARFSGLSDISGKGAWWNLASRVTAQVEGKDRFTVEHAAIQEERAWKLSVSDADRQRWQRAKAVFTEHPGVTIYCFVVSVAEHTLHPSPDVLLSARLGLHGQYWGLAFLWGGLLVLACHGWRYTPDRNASGGPFDRSWLGVLLIICATLTLSSGLSFGQGSRYRASLELIIPLLAGAGLVRVIRSIQSQPVLSAMKALGKR